MAGEFRHGTATVTFLVTPARGRVVAAKLGRGRPRRPGHRSGGRGRGPGHRRAWLPAKGVQVPLADPGLAARVAGLAAAVAIYGVLGTGLGALLGNQFAAVVAGLLLWQGGSRTWSPGSWAGPAWRTGCPRGRPRR
jgi:hypothetical protein